MTEPRPSAGGPLLEVTDLRISIPTEAGLIEAVRGVSFAMEAGDTLGVVGESGSGKTMLALAALGLVPKSAKVSGSIRLDGRELLSCTPAQWRSIRGARVSMVFQDPMTALNPMYKVGWQVAECIRLHERVSSSAAWRGMRSREAMKKTCRSQSKASTARPGRPAIDMIFVRLIDTATNTRPVKVAAAPACTAR